MQRIDSSPGGLMAKNSTCHPLMCSKNYHEYFHCSRWHYTGYLPGDDDDDSASDSELEQAWRDF